MSLFGRKGGASGGKGGPKPQKQKPKKGFAVKQQQGKKGGASPKPEPKDDNKKD